MNRPSIYLDVDGLLIKVEPSSNVAPFIIQFLIITVEAVSDIFTSKLMRVVYPSVPPVPNEPPVRVTGYISRLLVISP